MPSPSADPKFSLSILKFLSKLKFLKYPQNVLSTLKYSPIYVVKSHFWVYQKHFECCQKIEYAKKIWVCSKQILSQQWTRH